LWHAAGAISLPLFRRRWLRLLMSSHTILDRSVSHLLHRASQAVEAMFAEKGDWITPRQVVLLACVAEDDGLIQTEIVERTGIDRSTIADIVRRLSRRGLVQRQRSRKDRRAQTVRLTAKGRKALAAYAPKLDAIDSALRAALGKTRCETLLAGLAAITTLNEAGVRPAGGVGSSLSV
jgi:MarR family transcriptional regulator, temperature-dependent positive regulator of motility